MKTTITLFFLLASLNLYSQPYWMWENPRPIGARKTNCIFLNDLTYIVIGEYGSIIKTTNGGASWYQIEPKTQEDLRYITFINLSTGFICGDNGALLKSTDAGENWISVSPSNEHLNSIYFINDNIAFLGGLQTFLKTTDQGISWNNVLDTVSGWIWDIEFPSPQIGYAITSSSIIKTTNSGLNWSQQLLGGPTPRKLAFTTQDSGFALVIGSGTVYRTVNGIDWFLQNINATGTPRDIEFINNSTGFISCSSNNSIMRTTNSGLNWLPINTGQYVPEFDWLNENTALSIGKVNTPNSTEPLSVFRSTNAAANWFEVYSDSGKIYKINSIAYADTNYGVAVCDSGKILRTNNGVWTEVPIGLPLTSKLYEVKFINSFTGFIGGTNTFLKSTDKGVTWVNDFSIAGNVTTIDFMNETTGYIGGGDRIFKTTNAGNNWSAINVPGVLNAIYFKDSNTGLISSGDQIYRTTNGGINWEEGPGSIVGKKDIIFFNQNTGIVTGINLRTTNAGLNWSFVNSNFASVAKVNSTSGVATDGHLFYKTTDLGLTWHSFSQQANVEVLNAIEYLPNGQFVVGGNKGNILRTVGPGIITGMQSISSEIPESFSLTYNYPNPFNPVTKIRYDVPYRSNVRITIFDISGREIRTLINNFRDPGKYEIIFDGSGLSSGVYFYRIQTDDFSQTRKMILLK